MVALGGVEGLGDMPRSGAKLQPIGYFWFKFLSRSMIPIADLHGTIVVEFFVHLECLPQHMWLMAPSLFQALVFRSLKVVQQNGLVIWVSTFFNNHSCPLSRRKSSNVSEALIVDGLVTW